MKRRWTMLAEFVFLAGICAWAGITVLHDPAKPKDALRFKLQLRGAHDQVYLIPDGQGGYHYQIELDNGQKQLLTPDEFARRAYGTGHGRSWLEALLNVSGPVGFLWIGVGMIGQVLFTGRMVVQWVASERRKQSVVPVAFWWMSLVGGTLLLIYFIWRWDPVGVLSQAFGSIIYVRNLSLIYFPQPDSTPAPVTADPGPEPELNR